VSFGEGYASFDLQAYFSVIESRADVASSSSTKGAVEFAKRYCVRGVREEVVVLRRLVSRTIFQQAPSYCRPLLFTSAQFQSSISNHSLPPFI
jgi:hypothetical protein